MSAALVTQVVWQPTRRTFLVLLADGRADELSEAEAWSFARKLIEGLADLALARTFAAPSSDNAGMVAIKEGGER